MTNAVRTTRGDRVGRATVTWAVVYAGFGLACVLSGTRLPFHGGGRGTPGLGWAVVGLGLLAGSAAWAVRRHGPRSSVRALLWSACALAGAAAFSLLMDVITLLFGQGVDHPAATAQRALAAVGAVLLATLARSGQRPAGTVAPARPGSGRTVHLTAWAGTLAFVPYAAMKLVWACGGTFAGITGEEMFALSERNGASGLFLTLESWGLDPTALLAALGVFLLWGLISPWGLVFPRWTPFLRGRRVPRWLPLAPALLGAATLAPYGVIGVGYLTLATTGAVTMRRGDFHSSADMLLVAWIGLTAFAVHGTALAVAARAYWLRTRPGRAR
ncbi:hypothetical protein ABT084_02800 [Streptomyces sp. NPDC002138]|uniref:hypothetical protein n=1 Tax=Streptomyces sp. NPDC002138 TaxID=3154410 RepID=UPI00332D0306